MSLIANQHYSCRSEGSQVHIVPIVAQDVSEDMVSKDQQMALVLAARQESNDNQPSNEQKQNDGTVKKKPAGRPKGKAKSKAKAGTHAAAPKPEAKAKSKSQPKAKAKSKSQPRKRPAASLAQEAEAKRPTAFMAQEAEAKSPTASMAQEGVPESNDAKPEAPKVTATCPTRLVAVRSLQRHQGWQSMRRLFRRFGMRLSPGSSHVVGQLLRIVCRQNYNLVMLSSCY